MRVWLIALMIALLPLRGWVGDAMALGAFTAPETAAASCHETVANAAEANDAQHAGHDTSPGDAAPDGHHSHLACDLCNGPALASAVTASANPQAAPSARAAGAERFASLDPRPGHKPPIA